MYFSQLFIYIYISTRMVLNIMIHIPPLVYRTNHHWSTNCFQIQSDKKAFSASFVDITFGAEKASYKISLSPVAIHHLIVKNYRKTSKYMAESRCPTSCNLSSTPASVGLRNRRGCVECSLFNELPLSWIGLSHH